MNLRLRPVRTSDEAAFRSAHQDLWMSDRFAFGLNYDADEPFEMFVRRHESFAVGRELPEGHVPATFLVAVVDGEIVGRASIRHGLNDFLETEGGHIGYGVLHRFRQRGYATEILRQSLIIAASLGIASALLVCDEDNLASVAVIESCGGLLRDCIVGIDGDELRRYDIALN